MKLQLFNQSKLTPLNNSRKSEYSKQLLWVLWVFVFCVLLLISSLGVLVFRSTQLTTGAHDGGSWRVLGDDRVVSCYYNTPNQQDQKQLLPANIHPHLCTHINVAFAQVKDKKIHLDDHQCKVLAEIVGLKKINPKLRVLLSVGGASNDSGFPAMVADHASRKIFIKSLKTILRNHSLDGVDLDWEFPGVHDFGSNLQKRERQHFSQLLREIRMEYIREKRNYLLTVAIAAPQIIADAAYDVDQINLYVDYANIMTYDFHYFTEFTPFSGLNSPLYPRAGERLYMATLNINYTVHMYIDKGLERSKIVVGIPTYGHSFDLVNSNNGHIGSPASGHGALGELGFVNYPDICHFIKTYYIDVTVHFDSEARVPYLHRDHEWASFDNPESVMDKAKYIMENKLRGAMIYSLNADDYEGLCEGLQNSTKFPLAVSIKNVLNENHLDVQL